MAAGGGDPKCTACCADDGQWHDMFPHVEYNPDAAIGSPGNPEHLWVDGEWINERPRRVGRWVDGDFVYDDGHPADRSGRWVDGAWAWDDE